MRNWTIRQRIVTAFALILILVAGQAIASTVALRSVSRETSFVNDSALPRLIEIARFKDNVGAIQVMVLRLIMSDTAEERKVYEAEIPALRAESLRLLEEYKKHIVDAEEQTLVTRLETLLEEYVVARNEVIRLANANLRAETRALNGSKLRPAYLAYQAQADLLFGYNQALRLPAHAASAWRNPPPPRTGSPRS